jgi:hypothetical protein
MGESRQLFGPEEDIEMEIPSTESANGINWRF